MKHLIIVLVVVVAAIAGYFAFFKPTSPLKNAALAESRGDYEEARDQYIEALLEMTKTTTFPDCNRSKIVSQDVWYGEIENYLKWVSDGATPTTAALVNIMEGLKRCSTHVKQEILATVDSTAVLDTNGYVADWRRAFFPTSVSVEGNHGPLIAKALSRSLSFLRISALTSFTYHVSIIDMESWRRTDFLVYPDDEVSVLVRPGKHIVVASSEVTFPNGQLWKSKRNTLPVMAPDTTSLIQLTIKTRVSR